MEPLRLGRVPDPLGLGVDETEAPGANLFKSSSEAFRQDVAKRSEPKQPEFIQVADAKPASGSSFKFDLYGGGGEPAPSKPGSFKFNLYGEDTTPAPAPKPAAAEQGDTSRGFSAALGQTPALLKGAVGFAGAAGEKTFGEGGMFTALKKYGLEGYQKGMGEIEARAKETDDVTVAWKKAKEGDLGALVDWAQYGIGYLGGNVVETVGTSVLGGFIGGAMSGPAAPAGAATGAVAGAVGKEAVKGVAKNLIEGMVAKEAAKLAEKAGLETATDVMVRQATKNVAKEIGSVSALAGSSILKETGGIYGEAEEQAKKEGRELTGGDLARVFGAGVVAGLSEVAVDKLGLDVAAGKIKIPGGGRVGRAFIGGAAGVGIEGGQELFQTAVERVGAGQSLTDEDAIRDYINSFALGGLGGGTVGAISGALRSGKQDADTVRKLLDDAQKEMTSDDGRAELYNAMMNDEKMRPILEGNNIQSGDDPRFQSVITKAIATQRLLAELEPLSPEEQAAKRKEREADIQAAFGETASTAVGSNMGATDPLIQRESVTPNEQTKELEGVAQPVSLPGTDQQSGTLAMSGEDLVSAKQGFQVLPAFSTGGEPVANRFVSLSQAETFLFGPINKETGEREGGYTSSVDDMEFQIRQGKRSKETGGGTFYFIEGRPKSGLTQQIDEAANQAATSKQNDLAQPTEAQKAAGNYKKGSIKLMGLDISIENPRGSERSGTDASGKAWRTDMAHHYGYVKGSKGKDKDHVDVFIGPNPESTKVFVVDQKNPDGSFDEHKALLGFDTIEEAQAGYLANYQQGWQGLGAISEMPADAFKSWVKDGTKKKPLAYQEPKVTATTATPTATATPKTQNNQKQQSSDIESIASEWDRSNRTSRSQEWMAGAAESNPSFNAAEQEGASVPAHGMAKVSTLGQALKDLVSMLNGGIDSSRTLYYDSLTNPSPAAGAATGTSGGVAYRDGPFIITFREGLNGRQPTSADITGVLVNPANSELVGPLQQMFPNLVVRDYKEVAEVIAASRATTTQTKQEKANATQTGQEQQGGQPKREGTGGRLEEGRNNRQQQTEDKGKGDQASRGDQSAKGGTKQETVKTEKKTVEQDLKDKQKAKRTKVTKVEEKTEPTKRDSEQKKADETIGKNKVDKQKVIEDWEDNDDGVSPHVAWDNLSAEAKQMWTEAVADGYNSIMTHDLIVDGEAKNARVERASKVNKPMFRQTRGGKGMPVEDVETFVERMVRLWKNVPTINVVQSEKDLPKPLQQFITRAEANGKVPGIYWRGEVYLIADSLADNKDVGITVMHEVAGHYGLRSILGENFGKTMDQIYNGNATVRKLADAMMKKEGLTRQEAVEEVLADMAQNREAPSRDFLVALRQIFAAIRKWARETLGIKYMSDNDVREIVANARRFVIDGAGSLQPSNMPMREMVAALRRMQTTAKFSRWFGNSKIVDEDGKPKIMYHGSKHSRLEDTMGIRVFESSEYRSFLLFASPSADFAADYAKFYPDEKMMRPDTVGPAIYPVFIKAENPFDYENPAHIDRVLANMSESDSTFFKERRDSIEVGSWSLIEQMPFVDAAKKAGFDSLFVKELGVKNIAVLNPNQIKSIFNQNPTDSPDILKRQAGAPTFYSLLEREARGAKQEKTNAANWKGFLNALKSKGVKKDELEWTGVLEWLDQPDQQNRQITKEEVLTWIGGNKIHVNDVLLYGEGQFLSERELIRMYEDMYVGSEDEMPAEPWTMDRDELLDALGLRTEEPGTKHNNKNLTLPGGKEYVELVLVDPTKRIKPYRTRDAVHFGDVSGGRALGWLRMNVRKDVDGNDVLFLEEIQSQRGQDGRNMGFGNEKDQVPNAPLVKSTEAWVGLLMKRAIAYAQEKGIDRIAWTRGEQQVDRYKLSNLFDNITIKRNEDGTFNVIGNKNGSAVTDLKNVSEAEMSRTVGKDLATMAIQAGGNLSLSGTEMDVGNEGLKNLYDMKVGSVAKSIIKNFDGEVGVMKIEGTGDHLGFVIPSKLQQVVAEDGLPMFRRKEYEAQYDDLPENVRNIALAKGHYSPPSVRDRLEALKPNLWLRVVQGTFDRFRRVRDIDLKAYMMLRMSSATDGAVEGLLHFGRVFFDDGALNIVKGTKGLIEIMRPLGGETDRFLLWIAANRASNLAKEERERFFKPEEIKALQKLNQGSMKDGKSRYAVYAETLRQMNELNKSVLEVAKATGLIDAAAFKRFSEDIWYVPFYRQMDEDGTLSAANTSSAAVGQYLSKKLKGSERPLNDLMQNVLLNWSHILSASMKNAAANETLKAASSMGGIVSRLTQVDNRFGKDRDGNVVALKYAVKTMENGKEVYHNIEDEFLLASLDAVASIPTYGMWTTMAREFKTTLTRLISLSPTFKINNLIRDSIQSIGLSELSGSPMANVMQGWRAYKDKRAEALVGGGLFTLGNAFDGDRAASVKRLIAKGVDKADILTTEEKAKAWFKKFQDKYDEVSDASENANRIALYEQMRAKGASHLEAAYAARDLQDFGLQGSWVAIRYAAMILPYFNARLQGMYKLGREGISTNIDMLMGNADETTRQKAMKFNVVLGAVTAVGLALYLSQKDDDDWKNREEWDRDSFFWFKIPGTKHIVRVPKPFEMGAVASIVERFTEQMVDSQVEGKVFGARLLSILHDNLAINPIPQIVRPLYDIARNKDGFTDRPIESMGKERLSPDMRVNPNTSAAAVALGKINGMFAEFASSVTGGAVNANNMKLSPIQYDYMLRGYLGWLGTVIQTTSTTLASPFKEGESPTRKIDDMFVVGNFVKEVPATQSKYITSFYENSKEIATAMADYRSYLTAGEIDKAQEYLDNKRGLIVLNKLYSNISDKMSTISKRQEMIQDDPEMSGEEKRIELDRLAALKIELAKRAEDIRVERKRGE